jgi:ABC-type ATPase with predicted acetyltransferase domain
MQIDKLEQLESKVKLDRFTEHVSKNFDYEFTGQSFFTPFKINVKENFNIGLIVGSSGSGKSTSLKQFGKCEEFKWTNDQAIVSHFDSPENAVSKLSAMGLNSVPQWVKPYYALSTGEKFRADLAINLKDNAVFDEFTSVVDRTVARSACVGFSKYIKRNNFKSN